MATFNGTSGNDLLVGGSGPDLLSGGLGDDTYIIDDVGDLVIEAAGEGFDSVASRVSYRLPAAAHIELLTTGFIAGLNAIDLTGNDFGNQLWGNDAGNLLDGAGGDDALFGFGGNDVLYGGAGNDAIFGGTGADAAYGGAGNDTFFLDNAGDSVFEAANEGYDSVAAGLDYTLAAGVSVELLTTGFIAGTEGIDLTGNEFSNEIWGNNAGNVLNGGGGADALVGFGGNDTLIGGAGADALIGNAGDDTYLVDEAGDVVIELANEGFDLVAASVSYVLGSGAHVELVTTRNIDGTDSIDLAGNELANEIRGNNGSNKLEGGGGSDTLIGFAGSDTFAFTTALSANNIDLVADFQPGSDKIALAFEHFSALGVGEDALLFRPSAFHAGSAAHDADDRIIYNPATGALLYDADGSGSAEALQFASLAPGLSLTANDFLIINPSGAGYWDY